MRILRSVRELRGDVPILVRTQDDTKLEELQAAGATEVVPETFEASLMLLSHLLLLLKLPVSRVIRTVNDIRSHRYSMLRQYFPAAEREVLDDSHAFREELHSVILPPHAWAVGKSIADLAARGSQGRRQCGAARRNRRPRTEPRHPIQGGRRRRGLRHPRGGRACRNPAADGLNAVQPLYSGPRTARIVRAAVQGQTRRKVGTQNHRSKGLPRGSLTIAGSPVSMRLHAHLRVSPLLCPGQQAMFCLFSHLRGKHMVRQSQSFAGRGCVRAVPPASAGAAANRVEDITGSSRNTKAYPTPVRIVGADYSQTRCVGGDGGTTVDTGALDKILEFGETTVRAQAGVRLGALVRALAERGLELPLTPEMGHISLGAVAVTTLPQASYQDGPRSCPPASPN